MKRLFEQVYGNKLEFFEKTTYSMPLYLQEGKAFYRVSVLKRAFVIVLLTARERFNIQTLKKQLVTYQEIISEPVVYGFDKISSFQRTSLIENEVPFVARNGQMYLPFLGISFAKCSKSEEEFKERFSPMEQFLFLLLLYENTRFTKKEAADKLGVLPMSISRASKQLREKGLIEEKKQGTEIIIDRSVTERDAFYEKAERFLINPIQDVIYLPDRNEYNDALMSGEYSLSQRSDLGYPKYAEYALYKNIPDVRALVGVDPNLYYGDKLIRIQRWKYDPLMFSVDRQVDPVSLICTFAENSDERIQKCIKQVEEEIKEWPITRC